MELDKDLVDNSRAMAKRLASAVQGLEQVSSQEVEDGRKILDAMLLVRSYVLELEKNLGEASLGVVIDREDDSGWPAFKLTVSFESIQIGKLSIGAQDRRNGPILYIKDSFSDSVLELNRNKFSNQDELVRELKKSFRSFADEVENSFIVSKSKILDELEELSELENLSLEAAPKNQAAQVKEVESTSAGLFSSDNDLDDSEEIELSGINLFQDDL